MLLPNKCASKCFVVVGQKTTTYELKVNNSPDGAKSRGNAMADLQSTSSTVVVEVKLLLNNLLQLLAATKKLL